jgi:hypothetical protein
MPICIISLLFLFSGPVRSGETLDGLNLPDEDYSISMFFKEAFQKAHLPVYVVYDDEESYDAAGLVQSFLVRNRGFNRPQPQNGEANVFLIHLKKCTREILYNYRTVLVCDPDKSAETRILEEKSPIKFGKFNAVYKLYDSPCTLVVFSKKGKYFMEVVRYLLRNFSQYRSTTYYLDLAH